MHLSSRINFLLLLLISINKIFTASASIPVGDNVARHIQNCDKEFKMSSETNVKLIQRPSGISAGSPSDNLTAEVNVYGDVFQLELKPNKFVISPKFMAKSITVSGKTEYYNSAKTTASDCYYIGHVVNQPGSVVAVSTCDGFRAKISAKGNVYYVEPLEGKVAGRHRIYRESDNLRPTAKCGYGNNDDIARAMEEVQKKGKSRPKRDSLNWPNELQGVSKVVELYVANDYSQYLNQGSNVTQVFSRTKEIVNYVSALFQPLRVYVSLVGVEVWTTGNLIPISNDSLLTLRNFTQYRINNINPYHPNDNAQLFANFRYQNGVIGLSWISQMCTAANSAGIISDVSAVSGYTASVSAHEMGHQLGMLHDNQQAPIVCACDDPTGLCILNTYIQSVPPSRWSNCSTTALSSFLSTMTSACLNDFNGVLFDPNSLCGNGIVEAGEQCDCGNAPSSDCNPSCCNKTTCMLIGASACASGLCCNVTTCQLKPITTVCRAASGSCDLAEYCSGVNNTCPSDAYKQNGLSCTVGGVTSYCYAGSCKSRSSQCQVWWGPSTQDSASACYTAYNTQGKVYGHCGIYNQTSYIACSTSDATCGLLKCNVSSSVVPVIPISGYVTYYGSVSGNNCRIPVAPVNYVVPNLDMTPNGASCGASNMCVNFKCVTVASVLSQTSCPGCNSHGVCNNLGQCHCDVGYGPPNCSQAGYGGSYHSNQITQ